MIPRNAMKIYIVEALFFSWQGVNASQNSPFLSSHFSCSAALLLSQKMYWAPGENVELPL